MSLELKWLDVKHSKEKILLNNSALLKIGTVLSELEKKSGLHIDPYSDIRLSPDHASLLLSLIKDNGLAELIDLQKLIEMLMTSVDKSWWILVIGD